MHELCKFYWYRLLCFFGWHNSYIQDVDGDFICPCGGETAVVIETDND